MNFCNLTNGLEYIEHNIIFDGYIRIQSTKCEQKDWDFIINDLDYTFLINIALGKEINVFDMGAKKNKPRALYQGIEFIKYALNKCWLNKKYIPSVKNNNCEKYFEECYKKLNNSTIKKIKYFLKFLNTNEIKINCISQATLNDGNYSYYKKLLLTTSYP